MADFSPLQVAIMRAGTATTPWDNNPGLGGYLAEAQQQAAQQRYYDAQTRMNEYQLGEEQRIKDILSKVDINDPAAIAKIMQVEPELGLKLMQQQRLLREQQMMESLLSGGIGEMGDAGAYIMAGSENPILRGVGEMQLEEIKTQREIDKENRKAAKEAEKARKAATIPNFELQPDVVPSASDVSKAKQMLNDKQAFLSTLDEMERLFDKYGGVTETFNPTAAAEYRTKQKQIALAAKGLFELGALQAPDLELIDKMQIDPVGRDAAYRIDPKAIKDSIGSLRGFVENKVSGRMSGLGYKEKGLPTAAPDLSSMSLEQLEAERARLLQEVK